MTRILASLEEVKADLENGSFEVIPAGAVEMEFEDLGVVKRRPCPEDLYEALRSSDRDDRLQCYLRAAS
jgi:hypothetical protein